MSQPMPPLGERLMESLRFWAVVLVICAVVGLISYTVGRRYVGSHLHEMEITDSAPEIAPMDEDVVRPGEDADAPPEKPVITMREREPTARERREAEQELESGQPQDGADLHAREEDDQAADDEADQDAAPPEGGGFVVTAGSFASEENAQVQVTRLAGMGYQPYVTRTERDGVTFTRVNVGQFPTREEAQRVADELRARGFDSAVYSQ